MFKENISTEQAIEIGKRIKAIEDSLKKLQNSSNELYTVLEALGASKEMMETVNKLLEQCLEESQLLKEIGELLKK